jgi:hypothetical protein
VLDVAGGWGKVLESFKSIHALEMTRYPQRFMVLLIDFDNDSTRLEMAKSVVDKQLIDRVFILGTLTEPEELKSDLGSYESIGLKLAEDCRVETATIWNHPLLRHNAGELDRLRQFVRPILFESN